MNWRRKFKKTRQVYVLAGITAAGYKNIGEV
jgi:hypothetical protein